MRSRAPPRVANLLHARNARPALPFMNRFVSRFAAVAASTLLAGTLSSTLLAQSPDSTRRDSSSHSLETVVVTPQRFERQALLISRTPLLLVRGVLQVEQKVVNVRAKQFRALQAAVGAEFAQRHDFH